MRFSVGHETYKSSVGGSIGVLMDNAAAMGGSYEFFKTASANLREKDDAYNASIGGFVAGSMLGLRCEAF